MTPIDKTSMQRVVIVGAGPAGVRAGGTRGAAAGPAGVRAAEAVVAGGVVPVVIDEAPRAGGQIYRQPPADAGFARSKRTLYGMEAGKADAVHSTMARML